MKRILLLSLFSFLLLVSSAQTIKNDTFWDTVEGTPIYSQGGGIFKFKYKGKYYLCASNLYGWDASYAYYLMSDDIRGPYLPMGTMEIMDGCP